VLITPVHVLTSAHCFRQVLTWSDGRVEALCQSSLAFDVVDGRRVSDA
jgi:hypothetical protein